MSERDNGGPAFPCDNTGEWVDDPEGGQGACKWVPNAKSGMTLRDYFAGQALAGFMTLDDNRTFPSDSGISVDDWRETCAANDARCCYRYADAMLKVRSE